MSDLKIILASGSSGRKNILSTLKIPFEIIESGVNEDEINPPDPHDVVKDRARAKGEAVETSLISNNNREAIIIAADSMVLSEGKAYGKAKTDEEAKYILKVLSGKTHTFMTAVWVKNIHTGKVFENTCESKITSRKLTDEEINWYAKMDDLKKYAGAYSLFNSPQDFITKIEGSITNIVGLPLEFLIPALKTEGLLL